MNMKKYIRKIRIGREYKTLDSEKVQLEAVKENGYSIKYINEPSEAAIQASGDIWKNYFEQVDAEE